MLVTEVLVKCTWTDLELPPATVWHLYYDSSRWKWGIESPTLANLSTSQEPLTVLFVAITALESHVITSWCTSLLCSTVTKWVYNCCPWICKRSLASEQTLDLTWKNINLHRILANWRKGLRKFKNRTSMSAARLLSEQSLAQLNIMCHSIQLVSSHRQCDKSAASMIRRTPVHPCFAFFCFLIFKSSVKWCLLCLVTETTLITPQVTGLFVLAQQRNGAALIHFSWPRAGSLSDKSNKNNWPWNWPDGKKHYLKNVLWLSC